MSAPTQEEINRLLAAEDNAERESSFAESIRMDAQQISGTRYRIRLNESHEER